MMNRAPVPKHMCQERMSVCLVRALCAQAGLNIAAAWEWDDGLDLTIGSAKAGYVAQIRNVKFHLQVKSTVDWEKSNGKISFRIRKVKYNDLASPSNDPQHFVLYTLPRGRSQWVQSHPDQSVLNNGAYYLSFQGMKRVDIGNADEKMTIHLPTSNRLTASELLRMYREAAKLWT